MFKSVHLYPVVMSDVIPELDRLFQSDQAERVHPGKWQGIDTSKKPEAQMYELLNVDVTFDLQGTHRASWIDSLEPSRPWCDKHFAERVGGWPINPGVEWANWPWGNSASKFLDWGGDRFNHNYMERYWPRYAGKLDAATKVGDDFVSGISQLDLPQSEPHRGIRQRWGDLQDLVNQLVKDPLTRQAYLPIYFPEDTGEVEGGRKPCSLGYQFILREGHLHCYYPMRSCDFIRHFRDDVYLTLRLMEWVIERAASQNRQWNNIKLGTMQMHMTSLHMFTNDWSARYARS